jgi:DNA polymerase I
MIIDYYYPDDEWEGVGYPHVYYRYRRADGEVIEHAINPNENSDIDNPLWIPPHCWVAENTHPKKLSRLTARYPGVRVRSDIKAKGIDKASLIRLDVPNPIHLYDIKSEIQTYEADMPYADQLMIHAYPDNKDIPDFHPRIWYFDMEWQPEGCQHEGAITMIAIDDTMGNRPLIFAWKEGEKGCTIDYIEREGGYDRYLYGSEQKMLDAFLKHLNKCNPDILIAHAIYWADLPKLVERLGNKADKLSPLGQTVRPRKKDGYHDNAQPILGRLVYDTALAWNTGSGLEAVWQKNGRGTFRNKKLATIAEDLELAKELGEQGKKMDADVFTWWVENFDEFVDYCVRDTTLLRHCAEKVNAIPYHLAMQKECGVVFKSTCNVSRFVRGRISRHTDIKALTTHYHQRDQYDGADVPETVGGRHEGVACIDFKSMYPLIAYNANLCPTTKQKNGGDGIRSVGNGTHWRKEASGIGVIPAIIWGMLELRQDYKKKMKAAKSEDEKLKWDLLQTAVKVATNAIYGYMSQKKVSGGWIDPDVGRTITYYGRECINTLLLESEKAGYAALAGHTDSGYIQIPFDEIDAHLKNLNKIIRTRYELPMMEIELEAYFDYWLTADVKNQNFGFMIWPPEKKGQLKVTGFSYKASSVSPLTKTIQGKIFDLVGTGADEEEVTKMIREISLDVLAGNWTWDALSPYGKIGKAEYKRTPPMAVRGAYYYNDHINPKNPFRVGESPQWCYVLQTPKDMPPTLVVGFRDADEVKDFQIDYAVCVQKFIEKKIENIYRVLDWDIGEAIGRQKPKTHW